MENLKDSNDYYDNELAMAIIKSPDSNLQSALE